MKGKKLKVRKWTVICSSSASFILSFITKAHTGKDTFIRMYEAEIFSVCDVRQSCKKTVLL